MSRIKKSRNPGVGSSGVPKDTTKKAKVITEKRMRKPKGKVAGNRQKEAAINTDNQNPQAKKDPRLGNKTPIVLGKSTTKQPVSKPVKAKQSAVAAIRTVEPIAENTLMQELEIIEQDERLQIILAKQEDEIALTENEVDYFNDKMQRHQEICDILGLDDEEDDEVEQQQSSVSEDDLWDKFDNSDLSKFE